MPVPRLVVGLVHVALLCFAPVACATPGSAPAPQSVGPAQQPAIAAAEAWLKIVDAGSYGPSWDQAATLFRNAVTRSDWETALNGVRAPLGALVSRKVSSATSAKHLPGAPDGDYVVIQFETSFANKAKAVETVTPMLEPDGTWRVSGYFIR